MRTLRIVLVVLVALLAWLQYRLWFGSGGTQEVAGLQDQVEQQARQNDGLRDRNAALAAEVADLKSGEAAIEERARAELGMIRPGETFYRVVERTPPAPAADASPSDADEGETR
ncbi:cell division protein FtsB [Luteimonas sp. MC1895]|uniref:cell division protein FtsB n=1 Tax=Luteimonas sp. MC1895 TaxID=2819513 RepID=UPI0018F078F1|nr:cell division protein FtsB [Luteimonas sp. MC1895]MBJ6979999.1 cell division protein FtsB [Luteimonas sp. MC1895]